MVKWLKKTAEKIGIDVDYKVSSSMGTTDSTIIQLKGVLVGGISITGMNIHSSVEIVSLENIKNVANLIASAIKDVNKYF